MAMVRCWERERDKNRIGQGVAYHTAILISAMVLFGCDRPPPNPHTHQGPFAQLALAGTHTCVLSGSGEAQCWKYGRVAESAIPTGAYRSISSSSLRACGIRNDNRIACWGLCDNGSCSAPKGKFAQVAVSDGGGCALDVAGQAHCWGRLITRGGAKNRFLQIAVDHMTACGVSRSHEVLCWGSLNYSYSDGGALVPVSLKPPPAIQGRVRELAMGSSFACALLTDGTVECWGANDKGQTSVTPGRYVSVRAGTATACGVTSRGEVQCWGRPLRWRQKVYSPPEGPFEEVAVGSRHACARRRNGQVVCWGVDQQSQVSGRRWMLVGS